MFGLCRSRKYQGNINYLKERLSQLEIRVKQLEDKG